MKSNLIFTVFFIIILFSGTIAPSIVIDADALKGKGVGISKYGKSTDICGLQLCSEISGGKVAFTQKMENYLDNQVASELVPSRSFGLDTSDTIDDIKMKFTDEELIAVIGDVDLYTLIDEVVSDEIIDDEEFDSLFTKANQLHEETFLFNEIQTLMYSLEESAFDNSEVVDDAQIIKRIETLQLKIGEILHYYDEFKVILDESDFDKRESMISQLINFHNNNRWVLDDAISYKETVKEIEKIRNLFEPVIENQSVPTRGFLDDFGDIANEIVDDYDVGTITDGYDEELDNMIDDVTEDDLIDTEEFDKLAKGSSGLQQQIALLTSLNTLLDSFEIEISDYQDVLDVIEILQMITDLKTEINDAIVIYDSTSEKIKNILEDKDDLDPSTLILLVLDLSSEIDDATVTYDDVSEKISKIKESFQLLIESTDFDSQETEIITRSFVTGEINKELIGQIDFNQCDSYNDNYSSNLEECNNHVAGKVANKQKAIGCPSGTFADPVTGDCYSCPSGYDHDIFSSVNNEHVCWYRDYLKGHQVSAGAPGSWFSPLDVAYYMCYSGYQHDDKFIGSDARSCYKPHYSLPDKVIADDCASRGQFDGLDGFCYSCDDGFKHDWTQSVHVPGVCQAESEVGLCYSTPMEYLNTNPDEEGPDVRYGYATGRGFGTSGPVLDSVDCASTHHDNHSWMLTDGTDQYIKDDNTNNCALAAFLLKMPTSDQPITETARAIVGTNIGLVCGAVDLVD